MKKSVAILFCFLAFAKGTLLAQLEHTDYISDGGFQNAVTYDSKNNVISNIEQESFGNGWHTITIPNVSYNKPYNVFTYISPSGYWKCISTYDHLKNLVSRTKLYKMDTGYILREQYYYAYDDKNRLINRVFQESVRFLRIFLHDTTLCRTKGPMEFENVNKEIYTYDSTGSKQTRILQMWEIDKWVNRELWKNKGGESMSIMSVWNGTEWVPWRPARDPAGPNNR